MPGTEAALGWAGSHIVLVDRPGGKAGGMGLGFNGAQLLGLAIGGCYCNDLRYAAHDLGVEIGEVAVAMRLELEGSPLIETSAVLYVKSETTDGFDAKVVIDRAWSVCTVAKSLNRGVKTTLEIACSVVTLEAHQHLRHRRPEELGLIGPGLLKRTRLPMSVSRAQSGGAK